ncbi:MAG: sulfotransferase [Elainellaceae cyanobacterium]
MPLPKASIRSALIQLQRTLGIWPQQFGLITGAPRSGTTAVGSWLTSQREVAGLIESRVLIAVNQYIDQVYRFRRLEENADLLVEGARQVICDYYCREYCSKHTLFGRHLMLDKEPLEPIAFPDRQYRAFLDNVRIVFPGAKFFFLVRHPLATVFSMSQRKWGISLTQGEPRQFSIEEHTENWCDCVDCILEYIDDPDAYICQFERLVQSPQEESQRIFDFFGIRNGKPFQPRETKNHRFSPSDRALILERAQPQMAALQRRGLYESANPVEDAG